jgi:uncharacterized protein
VRLDGGRPPREAAKEIALQLDGSCLAIQGPPGSGKSTLAGEMIVALARAGKRVGVTANSHKVIGNLLEKVYAAAGDAPVHVGQKPAEGEPCACPRADALATNEALRGALRSRRVEIAGATIWAWARPELAEAVDVLFIDEAGQMSLANALAAAQCARSLVLLGDPQQLDQPVRGSHPPGAERSALAHLLDGHATMPPERGLFLEGTHRLRPELCAFTSRTFYDGLLHSEPACSRRAVAGAGLPARAGAAFLPVEHSGNGKSSPEEAARVARLVLEILAGGARTTDEHGVERPLTLDDFLVITPYNAQVRTIAEHLPGVHVGTVDKFQGQQAPISIYSLASSSAEDAPRGMEFLYSLNRLNVATSRAQCLAIVIASPRLLSPRCRTPRQVKLANALCRFVESARG